MTNHNKFNNKKNKNMNFEIIYNGHCSCSLTHLKSNSVIKTDAPLDMGGNAQSFSPTDLVVNALASCIITTIALKYKEFDDLLVGTKIMGNKIMAQDLPRRIQKIELEFTFPKQFPNDEKTQKIVQNIMHTCPVDQSLHPSIERKFSMAWQD